MGENPSNEGINEIGNSTVKNIANVLKNVSVNSGEETIGENTIGVIGENITGTTSENTTGVIGENITGATSENTTGTTGENASKIIGNEFKVAKTNLPEKTGFWTKVKNALLYEVKVELTPYQQKVEDEINDFLHQEVTWQSFKSFLFKEVPITYKGKRIF